MEQRMTALLQQVLQLQFYEAFGNLLDGSPLEVDHHTCHSDEDRSQDRQTFALEHGRRQDGRWSSVSMAVCDAKWCGGLAVSL